MSSKTASKMTATEAQLFNALQDALRALDSASTYVPQRHWERTGNRFEKQRTECREIAASVMAVVATR